jgi:enediyne biosynthesis protein E4
MSHTARNFWLTAWTCARRLFRWGILALGLQSISGRAQQTAGLIEQILAPLSGPRGVTMFTELSALQTGIATTNHYADPKMWGELNHEFESGAMGTGVAVGDYDGDGRPDLFVVSKTESCRLFRNLGDWKFEDVTTRTGVEDRDDAAKIWKQGATFADVNNDGLLDIYVCRFNAPNLLYMNQGNGTFKEMAHAYGLDLKDASVMAAFCDYDRDGWLDVFVQTNVLNFNQHPNGQRNYLFHNNRDGPFSNVTDRAGISGEAQGHSATWWDFNNDSWPDLYVANDFSAPDKLYRNNRNGTFSNVIDQAVPHMPFSSMGADLGDINNDGLIDFFTTDMAASTHEKDQRGMADSRARTFEDEKHPEFAPQYEHNALFINTGTGRSLEAAHLAGLATTDWTWAPRFEDLDNDGRLDLFITNGMHREATNVDLLSRQLAASSPYERVKIMRDSPMLTESHFAFRNLGDLEFENVGAAWGLSQKSVGFGAAFGDFDGDGDLDLVYTNYQKGVTVLRNDSETGHRVRIGLRGRSSNRFGVGATVRIETTTGMQVRQLVLARGILSSSEPTLHFGLGEDTVIKRLTVRWPSGQVQSFENLAVDRFFTIVEPTGAKPLLTSESPDKKPGLFSEVSVVNGLALQSQEELVDETALQRLLPVRLSRRGPSLAVAAFDTDSPESVVIGGTTLTQLTSLTGSVTGNFIPTDKTVFPTGAANDGPVLLFEAKGDGKVDLLVTKGGNNLPAGAMEYQPKLYFGDGKGEFQPGPNNALPPLAINVGAVAAADFNHDGTLDLFLGGRVLPGLYPLAPRSALLANHGGNFEDVTDTLAPGLREVGMVTAALWSDVDGDGWSDLLLTLEWGEVKCFHNKAGHEFEDWTGKTGFASAGTGWWTSVSAADFNGDGRPDYVVGNVGLNTQYHASLEHPALLFLGDFNGSGEEPQIVEAHYEAGSLVPWRSRKNLGSSLPSVLKRYPKNNAFARATVGEIFGEDKLAAAQRYAATELRSGVFLSQPNGTFHFEPLPRLAQIAPLQGTVAGDFDGDGNADIYAVQNSFAPIPIVGRFDGGLSQLLRGDGKGHFTPVPAVESNLIVSGDAKALAVFDLDRDGWPDFLISRNNSSTLCYRNNGVAGRHSLSVRLKGQPGNPMAVGARMTLELTNGSKQTSEVYAGSGYYSQSSAACFFGYPDSNQPKRLTVHWPSGASTEQAVPANSTHLTVLAPTP